MNSLFKIILFLSILIGFSTCKTNKAFLLDESYVFPQGLYICYGMKSCYNCLAEMKQLKTIAKNNKAYPIHLILETNMDFDNASSFIREMEKRLGFTFDKKHISKVATGSLFSTECKTLCNKGIVETPALLYIGEGGERVLPYTELFDKGDQSLNKENVRAFILNIR